jgi:ASC-1-like (ASCH) protein
MEFYYYITKNPINNETLQGGQLPEISKIRKGTFHYKPRNNNISEGPFTSLYELKKNSLIFAEVKLQKHKERILKNKNIIEIVDYVFVPENSSYEKTFMAALHHVTVGKISKQKVKGVHFYNPDRTRIIKKISENKFGVYSAKIEKYDSKKEEWFKKEEISNFFPDKWTIQRLFHECSFAYSNSERITGQIYKSQTISGVTIKFIINNEGKILTFYPEL